MLGEEGQAHRERVAEAALPDNTTPTAKRA